jgi:2-polyprenyl-3-methyl-5-hydroxy-6-metoxy-1,4-benzoquinol methylase
MSDYVLALSDQEIERYRSMAQGAEERERALWAAAGAVPGARIADVGSGPGAVSVRLAAMAAPGGGVWAVDRDGDALAVASVLADRSGVPVHASTGSADATGLPAGTFDLVMLRHVLAHNGGREQAIVDHLATLVRPGGAVYLADVDMDATDLGGADPAYEEMKERYIELHRRRGNDLTIGTRLAELLTVAGLEVVAFEGHTDIAEPRPGMRGPTWAARAAMVSEGLATPDDVARWNGAFLKDERDGTGRRVTSTCFTAYARRP